MKSSFYEKGHSLWECSVPACWGMPYYSVGEQSENGPRDMNGNKYPFLFFCKEH